MQEKIRYYWFRSKSGDGAICISVRSDLIVMGSLRYDEEEDKNIIIDINWDDMELQGMLVDLNKTAKKPPLTC
jgi:hypothetical protein